MSFSQQLIFYLFALHCYQWLNICFLHNFFVLLILRFKVLFHDNLAAIDNVDALLRSSDALTVEVEDNIFAKK
jgi:hypothetical protein